ncbi:MAG: hypothetical protein IJ300_05045 [Clostridia bacterium]|nr:hypothetical protein [Clostridia bacterium]
MKKDIFSNNIEISEKSSVIGGFIVFGIIMIASAISCGYVAYVGTGLEDYECLIMALCSALSFILAVAYPMVAIKLIRIYPKYNKLTHLLVNEIYFKDN